MKLPGWRALGITWAALLTLGGGGALWLDRLGPLPPAVPQPAPGLAAAGPPTVPIPNPNPNTTAPALRPPVVSPEAAPTGRPATAATTDGEIAVPEGANAPPPIAVASGATRNTAGIDPALTEPGRYGPLPRISADNRTPIRTYARPFDRSDTRPRIAIILGDIGLNAALSEEAIRRLPPAVTLALTPYGFGLPAWADRARERGAEILLAIPMEPAGYPMNDPGDRALLTGNPANENIDRLTWAMGRFQGYVGAIGAIAGMRGERLAAAPEAFNMLQDALRSRGLLYVDPRPGARNPPRVWGRAIDMVIDEPATRGEIERRLTSLEALARERGAVVGLAGGPTPLVVERLAAWAATLDSKNLTLAPISSLIRRPDALAAEAAPPARTP